MNDCCVRVSEKRSTQKYMLYGREETPFIQEMRQRVKETKEAWETKLREVRKRREALAQKQAKR